MKCAWCGRTPEQGATQFLAVGMAVCLECSGNLTAIVAGDAVEHRKLLFRAVARTLDEDPWEVEERWRSKLLGM